MPVRVAVRAAADGLPVFDMDSVSMIVAERLCDAVRRPEAVAECDTELFVSDKVRCCDLDSVALRSLLKDALDFVFVGEFLWVSVKEPSV